MIKSPAPLADDHEIDDFASGEPQLDDWLRRRARANQASGASRTYVACEGNRVVAYYALASGAIDQAVVPGKFRRNMPDPIPVAVLARLAVDDHLRDSLGRRAAGPPDFRSGCGTDPVTIAHEEFRN